MDDILLPVEHFYQEACRQMLKSVNGFAPDVLPTLQSYPWPGNVRELQNEIHQAYALACIGMRIQTHHFSPQILKVSSSTPS